jgi:hypothetical protein
MPSPPNPAVRAFARIQAVSLLAKLAAVAAFLVLLVYVLGGR